jgi:hypothetical protein
MTRFRVPARGGFIVAVLLASASCDAPLPVPEERALGSDERLPAFLLDSYPAPPPFAVRTPVHVSALVRKHAKTEIGRVKAHGFAPAAGRVSADTGFEVSETGFPGPSAEDVASWLIGQQFVFSRDLFGTPRFWTVEPGELVRIEMGPVEFDERRGAWSTRLTIELVARKCGLELEGALRFNSDGAEGRVHLHDFTPTRRRRYGRCG